MAAATTSEHRLQMRVLFVLSLLGILIALGFSQSAGLFNPPAIVAAGAQTVPDDLAALSGGGMPGVTGAGAGSRNFIPRTPGVAGGTRRSGLPGTPIDDGRGGPIEIADATGATPPPLADDLTGSPVLTDGGGVGDGAGNGGGSTGGAPIFGGPGGSTPGAVTNPTTPTTPTTPVPEPATWLILIVGSAMVGGALRRRTSAAAGGVTARA